MKLFICTVVLFFFATNASADEKHLSLKQAKSQGFKISKRAISLPRRTEIAAHSLDWPVQFIDNRHSIGNSMPEYQNYGDPAYFHMGCDLRVAQEGAVTAPIDGFLQGDYYSYVTNPDTGEDKKYTKPLTEGGDDLYFELTITTPDNYMFEFHHVNPNKLPPNIRELVLRGGGQIRRGDVIGKASVWPVYRMQDRYDHIHYNLVSPTGKYLNHEYFARIIPDSSAPVIKNIFAIYADRKVEVLNQTLKGLPQELVISTYDMKGENIYPLPPVLIEAAWGTSETEKVFWDFTKSLLANTGLQPDIRELYARNLRLSDGRSFTTKGDYSSTEFLFRLKLPKTVTGPITLTVKDNAGNEKKVILTGL